ncbi:hypothetical protein NPIL_439581 [Nephila pilipes]|uniref:Uncharacterized protein n=1 Tax=Nephila pilipes TaxID=299642 RepID=A0A8X6MV43_NEPPI|nr:hypothetical protein NPIL_439581 [Nephila pilipes]
MKESFNHSQKCPVFDILRCTVCSSFTLDALCHSNKCKTNGRPALLCETLKNFRKELKGLEKLRMKDSAEEGSASAEEGSASAEEESASTEEGSASTEEVSASTEEGFVSTEEGFCS